MFPPKHAPNKSAHHNGRSLIVTDSCSECRNENNIIHKCRPEGGNRENKRNQPFRGPAGDLGKAIGKHLIDAGMFKRTGNGKEQHEEDESPPIDFVFNVESGA